ncbi:hypothetical protein [Enterococcus sp. HY326]|uniref:hypothetical protein n=1 Tax=Enterococcus sp. HY326 TaxID=2971265 RepID=UPI00223F378B|nr:hypothetical protein [Enterococcus sp. HY326]
MKYYDVTFHQANGQSVVKRSIPSELPDFETWQDACAKVTDKELHILINNGTQIVLNRNFIVRIDIDEVADPIDKDIKRHDEIMGVVNALSNMGF